jgi:soluble lytic murein transglycosylase-like protein
MKRLLTGCLLIGLAAAPGLAKADDAVPQPTPAVKAPAKSKAGPPAKKTAAKKSAVKPASDAADLLLPQPAPLDTGLAAPARQPVRTTERAATPVPPVPGAATRQTAPQLVAVPLPPERPLELARLDRGEKPTATEEALQTASIPISGPLSVNVDADNLVHPGAGAAGGSVDALISKHAQRYGLPESLLRRVVKRESGGNPRLRHGPYIGLMQMRLDTARGMGYSGGAEGLLDADTSLTYGAAYLANAWRVSGGNADRAVSLYAGGYYYEAKRKGMLSKLIKGKPEE